MKKNGFTLIELLAVIVILAVIALIVTPIVTNIISQVKMSASARSAEQYVEAVNVSSASSLLTQSNMENGRYFINNEGNIEKDGNLYQVKINGNKPTSGEVTILKGKVIDDTIVIDNNVVSYKEGSETKVQDVNENKIYGLEYNISTKTYTRLNDASELNSCVGTDTETCVNDFDKEEIYRDMVETTDEYGNVFIKIPKFYMKKEVSDRILRWYVSKTKQDDSYYLPNCFYDFTNNKELDYVLVGKYDASLSEDGTKLESKNKTISLVSKTISEFRNYALANNNEINKGYQQLDIHVWDALQTLFYIEFSNLDCQSVMQGFTTGISPNQEEYTPLENNNNTNSISLPSVQIKNFRIGQLIDISTYEKGFDVARNRMITNINLDNNNLTFDGEPVDISTTMIISNSPLMNGMSDKLLTSSGSFGDNDSGKYSMNYRGLENIYGNIWQFIDGIKIKDSDNGKIYVNKDANTYISNSISTNYYEITEYKKISTEGYIKKIGYDENYPYVQFVVEVTPNPLESIYKDYYLQENTSIDKIVIGGGLWYRGNRAGLSYYCFYYNDKSMILDVGGRLVKK